jgi:transcriptional regulator
MYLPEHFRESRADVLHGFIAQHPLAILVAQTAEGLIANHIPMLWMGSAQGQGPGILRGHVARANRLWRLAERGARVLAIFTGEQHYVSPTWYPSKQVDGKVVPTWNYAAVHVHGTIQFVEDAGWLLNLVETLTDAQEGERPGRWHVSDAPPAYIDAMLRAIVGFEIEVTGIEGKFKGSQNRSMEDRTSVASRLSEEGFTATQLAELVPGADTKS